MSHKSSFVQKYPKKVVPYLKNKRRISSKILTLISLIILMSAFQVANASYTALANYDFYGLSTGTSVVDCSVNSATNQPWVLAGKQN